jgi:tetratricopeptide (TPR) repeat protein
LAFDAGQQEVARGCFTDALATSRQANNAQLETRALANLAMQSNTLTKPREAMRYATGAEHAARGPGATPWLAAIPQLRLAIGSSLSGDARDTDHAISRARSILERDNNVPNEEWSAFLSPLEVDAIEASCALDLRQPARAERLLEQVVASYVKQCARNVALYRVWLAQARLQAGSVDGAVEAAHAALDDLSGEVESQRVNRELQAVVQRLAAYPEVDGVDRFIVRYQAMN